MDKNRGIKLRSYRINMELVHKESGVAVDAVRRVRRESSIAAYNYSLEEAERMKCAIKSRQIIEISGNEEHLVSASKVEALPPPNKPAAVLPNWYDDLACTFFTQSCTYKEGVTDDSFTK